MMSCVQPDQIFLLCQFDGSSLCCVKQSLMKSAAAVTSALLLFCFWQPNKIIFIINPVNEKLCLSVSQPATVTAKAQSATLTQSCTGPLVTEVTAKTVPTTPTDPTVSAAWTTTTETRPATAACPAAATPSVSHSSGWPQIRKMSDTVGLVYWNNLWSSQSGGSVKEAKINSHQMRKDQSVSQSVKTLIIPVQNNV